MTGEACLIVRITGAVYTRSTWGSAPALTIRNSYSDSSSRQTAQAARLAGPVVAVTYAASGNFPSVAPASARCRGAAGSV